MCKSVKLSRVELMEESYKIKKKYSLEITEVFELVGNVLSKVHIENKEEVI